MNWSVLLRIYTMIAAVTAVSLFVFASQFSNAILSVAVVAVGTVAFVSVILGALLAGEAYLEEDAVEPIAADGESGDARGDAEDPSSA